MPAFTIISDTAADTTSPAASRENDFVATAIALRTANKSARVLSQRHEIEAKLKLARLNFSAQLLHTVSQPTDTVSQPTGVAPVPLRAQIGNHIALAAVPGASCRPLLEVPHQIGSREHRVGSETMSRPLGQNHLLFL